MRSFIASADRTSRAVGPARSRRVCRSLLAPLLLRLRLWRGYSGSRGTAFDAARLYLRDQCRDAGPNKTAARRLEGRARSQPRRPRGPRGGGLAGNTRVAGADGPSGKAARGDNDCRRAEAPAGQRRPAHRPRSARPRGAEGRYARHLPHGCVGLRLPSGGTGGVRAIGRVCLRLLDPERSTAGVSGHRSARRSGGTEGQLPPVRERRSNGLDRSAWRISRLDRCRSRSTHALRCSLNFRVGSLSGYPCLRSGWPRCSMPALPRPALWSNFRTSRDKRRRISTVIWRDLIPVWQQSSAVLPTAADRSRRLSYCTAVLALPGISPGSPIGWVSGDTWPLPSTASARAALPTAAASESSIRRSMHTRRCATCRSCISSIRRGSPFSAIRWAVLPCSTPSI